MGHNRAYHYADVHGANGQKVGRVRYGFTFRRPLDSLLREFRSQVQLLLLQTTAVVDNEAAHMHTHTHTNGPDQPLQHVHTLLFLQLGSLTGVHADYLFIGLARTMYIRCIYGICGREITRYTVIYGVCIRFWPTLPIQLQSSRSLGNAAPISISHLTRCLGGSPYNVLASKVG